MFKILPLIFSLLIGGCALTGPSADQRILVKKQNIDKLKPNSKRVKKLTDSKNIEDDNFFEFILTKIDKAITYIISDKSSDKSTDKKSK